MNEPGTPTFDQLRIFLTIVDTGSFAAAARRLNRAVSVISYGIANLEAQLGVRLFERTTRRLRLTEAGAQWLPHARQLLAAWEDGQAALRVVSGGSSAMRHTVPPEGGSMLRGRSVGSCASRVFAGTPSVTQTSL